MRLRVYDHSEVLAPLERSAVVRVLRALVERWAGDANVVSFVSKQAIEEFFAPDVEDATERFRAALYGDAAANDPGSLLARIVRTPRQLRRVVRSAASAWELLRGEVNPFELVVLRAIYEVGPAVFEHTVQQQYQFRRLVTARTDNGSRGMNAESWFLARNSVMNELQQIAGADHTKAEGADPAALAQLVFWLWQVPHKHEDRGAIPFRPQAVSRLMPTDYLARIVEQRISAADLPDQSILKVLAQWQGGPSEATIGELTLPMALVADPKVGPKVEQFGQLVNTTVYVLASEYFQAVLMQPRARAVSRNTPGFWQLQRIMLQGIAPRPQGWLEGEFDRAAPISLPFALTLLHWWQHRNSLHIGESDYIDWPVWQHAWATLERLFAADPAAYAAALDSADPWTTWKLATGEGKSAATLEQQGVSVAWWADMLLSATRSDPQTVIPQLGLLLVAPGDHFPDNPNPPMALRQDWLETLYPKGKKRTELVAAIDHNVHFTQIEEHDCAMAVGAHRFLVDYLRSLAGPGPASPPDLSGLPSGGPASNPDIAQLPAELVVDLVI